VKYWTYIEPKDDWSPLYLTYSEDEIIEQYYPYWYSKMCKKFGKEVVDRDYSKQDCIQDWVVTHWAWESK